MRYYEVRIIPDDPNGVNSFVAFKTKDDECARKKCIELAQLMFPNEMVSFKLIKKARIKE